MLIEFFTLWNKDKRNQAIRDFYKGTFVIYSITFGVAGGFASGTVARFLYCHEVMEEANGLISNLEEYNRNNGQYPTDFAFLGIRSPIFRRGRFEFQQAGIQDHIYTIEQADATVFLSEQNFYIVIPYEHPYLLFSGISKCRLFLRDGQSEFWQKKYLIRHVGNFWDLVKSTH